MWSRLPSRAAEGEPAEAAPRVPARSRPLDAPEACGAAVHAMCTALLGRAERLYLSEADFASREPVPGVYPTRLPTGLWFYGLVGALFRVRETSCSWLGASVGLWGKSERGPSVASVGMSLLLGTGASHCGRVHSGDVAGHRSSTSPSDSLSVLVDEPDRSPVADVEVRVDRHAVEREDGHEVVPQRDEPVLQLLRQFPGLDGLGPGPRSGHRWYLLEEPPRLRVAHMQGHARVIVLVGETFEKSALGLPWRWSTGMPPRRWWRGWAWWWAAYIRRVNAHFMPLKPWPGRTPRPGLSVRGRPRPPSPTPHPFLGVPRESHVRGVNGVLRKVNMRGMAEKLFRIDHEISSSRRRMCDGKGAG